MILCRAAGLIGEQWLTIRQQCKTESTTDYYLNLVILWTKGRRQVMSLEFEVNNSGTSLNATVDQHIRMGAGEWTPQSHHKRKRCCSRCTSCCVWMTSALGVSLLLVLYLTLGAIMFMFLGSISQSKFIIPIQCQIS